MLSGLLLLVVEGIVGTEVDVVSIGFAQGTEGVSSLVVAAVGSIALIPSSSATSSEVPAAAAVAAASSSMASTL